MEKIFLINPDYPSYKKFKSEEYKTHDEAEAYAKQHFTYYNIEEVIPHRDLFFKDIMARIPFGVVFRFDLDGENFKNIVFNEDEEMPHLDEMYTYWMRKGYILPYLRSMESMTEEESKEFALLQTDFYVDGFLYPIAATNMTDWLNAHHFDYRGLISKGLAIEAPKSMYLHFGDMKVTTVTVEHKDKL